jgi:hypothetical protein
VTDFVIWPHRLLVPGAIEANVVPFSRSGGTTLGGLQRVTRTDRGWWSIAYKSVPLKTAADRRMFNALATHCSGMATPIVVPVWSQDAAEWPAGTVGGMLLSTHSDGTTHGDGSLYAQPAIDVTLVGAAALGATSVTLRIGAGIEDLIGVRFSYQHALYKTGYPTVIDGTDWTVPITPSIRAPIPDGAALEFGLPTCLVRLASDREMDASFTAGFFDRVDVAFVEAADYWNDLAEE